MYQHCLNCNLVLLLFNLFNKYFHYKINFHSLNEKLKPYPPIFERTFNESDSNSKSEFRIMQWNMLARALHYSGDHKNVQASDVTYDWENFRLFRTLQELVRYDCDIVCVEEADFYEEIKPYMHSLG